MTIIYLIITLAVIGALFWLLNNYIPMDGKVKKILNVILLVCAVVWLLSVYGVIG